MLPWMLVLMGTLLSADDPRWVRLSSTQGDLPALPGGSLQQTAAVTGDFDGDGLTDFIIGFRQKPPALTWYRRKAGGWDMYVIEKDYLTIEAGGAVHDIDGDGDLDVVFGGDYKSPQVWWWENPSPDFDRKKPWTRRIIKAGGKTQHHDQAFGDFLGTGKAQLAFWNQKAKSLFLAEIPKDVHNAGPWPITPVISSASPGASPYTEGMSAFDVDRDGKLDLLAHNMWFKHLGGKRFKAIKIAEVGGLIFAGYFKSSKVPQIVISPGDGVGPVRWHECIGDPEKPGDWRSHDLVDRKVIHGHSLQLGDVNGDGHLDIFLAEMAKWRSNQKKPDHPGATAFIFYGNGRGEFRRSELVKGHGWHEARLSDLDGDGDLDILNKPYTWETPRLDVWLQNGTRPGARGVGTGVSFPGPVGLQLYSLRGTFAKHVPLGFQLTRNFGFVEVELAGTYGMDPAQFRRVLAWHGFKPVAAHFSYDVWAKEPAKVVKEAGALGVKYAGCAWIPRKGPLTEAKCREAIAVFNRAGAEAAKLGMKFFYHNHGYEFVPYKDGTLFDLMVQETNPEHVCFEMDIFWVVHPGQDPVKLLRKYPDRWELFHLKDMRKGVATGKLTGSEDVRNDVVLGAGQVDLKAALKEAVRIGVKHYFIEDESPLVIEQIPESLRFLESLKW